MSRHAGEINEGQVIIERIDAMVTTTAAPVRTVTADALLWQKFIESSKGEASTPSPHHSNEARAGRQNGFSRTVRLNYRVSAVTPGNRPARSRATARRQRANKSSWRWRPRWRLQSSCPRNQKLAAVARSENYPPA